MGEVNDLNDIERRWNGDDRSRSILGYIYCWRIIIDGGDLK